MFLDAGRAAKQTRVPSQPETPDSQSPTFPDSRAAPSSWFPLSRGLEMLWGAFQGGRFILPGGNRIISLPSFPRGNPVSFPCSAGEEVSGLALTVPGGHWIPRGGNPASSPGGSPFPKRFPQCPLIPERVMGPSFHLHPSLGGGPGPGQRGSGSPCPRLVSLQSFPNPALKQLKTE